MSDAPLALGRRVTRSYRRIQAQKWTAPGGIGLRQASEPLVSSMARRMNAWGGVQNGGSRSSVRGAPTSRGSVVTSRHPASAAVGRA